MFDVLGKLANIKIVLLFEGGVLILFQDPYRVHCLVCFRVKSSKRKQKFQHKLRAILLFICLGMNTKAF